MVLRFIPLSCHNRCYHEGLGVPRDQALALTWLRRAAESGEVRAQLMLGDSMRSCGRVLDAAFWYRKAHTEPQAQDTLRLLKKHHEGTFRQWQSCMQVALVLGRNLYVIYEVNEAKDALWTI